MSDVLRGNRFDRRKFLVGAGGALLAIPMLESVSPRRAFAQTVPPPKRLIVVLHEHGRVVGGLSGNMINTLTDWWSPGSSTMALPGPSSDPAAPGPSKMLAALAPITDEIVTVDGIDNVVRHAATQQASDGHFEPNLTCLNCTLPKSDGSGGAASIDYVAGARLTAGTSIQPSIIFDADSGSFDNGSDNFWGLNGTPSSLATGAGSWVDPADAITRVFAGFTAPGSGGPPPTPTLLQRLQQNRTSVLDNVLQSFKSLRAKVNAADQARLDQHADFVRSLETTLAMPGGAQPLQSCTPPDPKTAPNSDTAGTDGSADDVATPAMMNVMVQALACDLCRCAGFAFENNYSPTFSWLFGGSSPYSALNWHAAIHEQTPTLNDLQTGFQFYPQMFTRLVQTLAATQDIDGSRMLDNTIVVWVSPMGYGSTHECFNIPVVLAGGKNLPGAFPKGHGRHVVCASRNSLGDLWAQVLRMLGGTDMTFGATGTLASFTGSRSFNPSCEGPFCAEYGYPGYIGPDTPLHSGPIDL
jgi:hypothetical protein